MREHKKSYNAYGRCVRISYLGPKGPPMSEIEHLAIAQFAGRKKISIRSLGGEFTYGQVRTIARAMLSMVEEDSQ